MGDIFEDMEKPFLPMLISNWIFGIGIIEYPIRRQLKLLSIVYSTLILVVYAYLVYICHAHIYLTAVAQIKPIIEMLHYYTNILITISIIIFGWFQTQGLQKCMLKAAQANLLMQQIGIFKNHSNILKNELRKFMAFFLFILSIIIINSTVTFYNFVPNYQQIIFIVILQNVPLLYGYIADSSFLNIIGYAYFKFDSLNKLLKSISITKADNPMHKIIAKQPFYEKVYPQVYSSIDYKDYTFLIKKIKLAHLRLVKLCREANNLYSFHILLSIAIAFVMIINKIFNIYVVLNDDDIDEGSKFRTIVRSVNWLIYYIVRNLTSCCLCTTVLNTATKTGDLICELYDEPYITENTRAEIRYFNIELVQNKLEFSAYGVVNIDLTLLQVMASTIATYIIIIVQFQKLHFVPNALVGNQTNTYRI
ncbi:gustatory receptor 51 [Nasonia vitripennis]|uniref:Gustatory receptor n=1 Tax=Nasonia vitripennis TaxID=7425 RepID=A0A7M6UDV3_NASVI|nr:gustatory receptor 51 [Nasonia vitripennis]